MHVCKVPAGIPPARAPGRRPWPARRRPDAGGNYCAVYAARLDGRDAILRAAPPNDETTPDSARAVLAWLAHAAAGGGAVPRPIPSRRGLLGLLEVAIYTQAHRHAGPAGGDDWVGRFMRGREARIAAGAPYVDLDWEALAVSR